MSMSSLHELCPDLIGCIFSFLDNDDKLSFLFCCRLTIQIRSSLLTRFPFQKVTVLYNIQKLIELSTYEVALGFVQLTVYKCTVHGLRQAFLSPFLKNVTTFALESDDDFNLEVDLLPPKLKSLRLDGNVIASFDKTSFPCTLSALCLGFHFNRPLLPDMLPDRLEELELGSSFNQPIEQGVLPKELRVLNFNSSFNQPLIQGVLPENLEALVFDCDFDQPIKLNVLPSSLKELIFGYHFNQPLGPGILPSGLKELSFLKNGNVHLPEGLTYSIFIPQ